MPLTALDHYTIRTSDLNRSVRFYSEILGLENGARPPFRTPGAWLYCDGRPVVHLAQRGQKAGGETGNGNDRRHGQGSYRFVFDQHPVRARCNKGGPEIQV